VKDQIGLPGPSRTAAPARYVMVGGIRTRYFDQGSGPVILLIHGGGYDYRLGVACDDWEGLFDELAAHYRVIAVDKLGAGGTDSPAADADFTQHARTNHLVEFIRELGLRGVVLVGHSRGALEAAQIALELPGFVTAVVLLDSSSLPPSGDQPATVPASGPVVPSADWVRLRLGACFANPEAEPARAYLLRKQRWCGPGPHHHEQRPWLSAELARAHELDGKVFLPDMNSTRTMVLRRIEKQGFRQPVLIIWGMKDFSAPFRLGLKLLSLVEVASRHVEFHALSCGRHLIHLEFSSLVGGVIHEFLTREADR